MINKKIKKLLYKSFDGSLTDDEQSVLNEALKNSNDLKHEQEQIKLLRSRITEQSKKDFEHNFEDKVLKRISSLSLPGNGFNLFLESLTLAYKKVVVSAIALIIILFTYKMTTVDEISVESILGISTVNIVDIYDPTTLLSLE